jgi:hypothetical protein
MDDAKDNSPVLIAIPIGLLVLAGSVMICKRKERDTVSPNQ